MSEKLPHYLINAIKMQMQYNNQRQVLLSKNVANADTPGYKTLDLKPLDFNQVMQSSLTMTLTSPMHIKSPRKSGSFAVTRDPDTPDTTLTGNNVRLEDQMMKMSENSQDYQTTTNLYKKIMAMLKTAAGRPT